MNAAAFHVTECSGCFMVGNVEFSGEGRYYDQARATEYCIYLNLPAEQQTQAAFFALTDVKDQQDAQKKNPHGSTIHQAAYNRICELAAQTAAPKTILLPEDY